MLNTLHAKLKYLHLTALLMMLFLLSSCWIPEKINGILNWESENTKLKKKIDSLEIDYNEKILSFKMENDSLKQIINRNNGIQDSIILCSIALDLIKSIDAVQNAYNYRQDIDRGYDIIYYLDTHYLQMAEQYMSKSKKTFNSISTKLSQEQIDEYSSIYIKLQDISSRSNVSSTDILRYIVWKELMKNKKARLRNVFC
jgi:hypothetical protein